MGLSPSDSSLITDVSPLIGSLIGLESFEFQHADSSVVNRLFLCLSLMIRAERKCVYTSILQEELLSDEHSICQIKCTIFEFKMSMIPVSVVLF